MPMITDRQSLAHSKGADQSDLCMVCTSQFLPLLNKSKIILSQIVQIMLISLEFSPAGYCIHSFVLLGQPHIVSTRENSLRPLELIYTHKNVDF